MQCVRPLVAGFDINGNVTFSQKEASKLTEGFKVPCRKCLPCRLNTAREKAIRAYHESSLHDDNIFLTLTYDEDHLESPWLDYSHFQRFMKRLRHKSNNPMSYMVTGEYGDANKRPHWHAIIFGYRPTDAKVAGGNSRGESYYTSREIESCWKYGFHNFGDVTMESASYVARYGAKKLVHGKDQDHCYHPIHHTSTKHGLGKEWIKKNYRFVFTNGFCLLPNGEKTKIPRYYVDWVKKEKPGLYHYYVTKVQPRIIRDAIRKEAADIEEYMNNPNMRAKRKSDVRLTILESKFKRLQEQLKL